ncbi:hypothetical protein QYE76_041996 [Lolium multiflorum]|uniref:Retrotransposon gag domain-containing protein n=1 Tax=Lolium multiflorum TaxID=4521 RepID=A0AAD8TFT2_LOLMU|nr:hypothetical protein QYE76_041996 [Lolium multiflorum]
MGEAAAVTEASLTEIRSSLDLLHGRVACMDTTQQQLVAQLGLIAAAVQDGAKLHNDAARQFSSLDARLAEITQGMERLRGRCPSPEEDDPDPGDCLVMGTGTLRTTRVTWTGDAPGASTAAKSGVASTVTMGSPRDTTDGGGLLGGGGTGGAGGGGTGGAGGGGTGGAGGGRHGSNSEQNHKHHLKMSFPRFDGDQPRIWKDKCLDYFRLFNVHASLWLVSCTLHMDGNAALWLKAHRLRHEVNSWPELMRAAEEKFGADDYRRYLKQLLALKQKGTVEEYQLQFEELSYQIVIQNPHYDDQF